MPLGVVVAVVVGIGLLYVPVLGWLFGIVIGLALLGKLISSGKWLSILYIAPLAIVGGGIAPMWWAPASHLAKAGMVVGSLACILATFWLVERATTAAARSALDLLRDEHGADSFQTVVGTGEPYHLAVDVPSRRLALCGGGHRKVFSMDEVTDFEVCQELRGKRTHNTLKIMTRSFDLPVLPVPVRSFEDGEAWMQRLRNL